MMPPEFRALLQRYVRIATLLDVDAIRSGEIEDPIGQQLVINELDKVKGEIDSFLDDARVKRLRH